jgi:HSP20 family protein
MTNLIPWMLGRRMPAPQGVRSFSWDLGEFDRLFEDAWGVPSGFQPRVDVAESETEYRITAELPGLEEKDFEIALESGVLTLKGEKRSERDESSHGYRHVETVSGRFERRFQLPAEVEDSKVSAAYKNGVLTIIVPKAEKARPRTITVQAG